jgi:hypothetical protein
MADEKNIRYYIENKEKIKNTSIEYYKENKDEILKKRKIYEKENKEKIKLRKRKNYEKNKNEILRKNKIRYQTNKEKYLLKQRKYNKNHKKEKAIYDKKYQSNRLKTDINYKIAVSLRDRLRKAIHSNQKSGSAVKDLGCSVPELKTHLESKFQEGMNWDNWGEWHIDHIKPLASFNLQDRIQFLKANHYSNLQPLWAEENTKKGTK